MPKKFLWLSVGVALLALALPAFGQQNDSVVWRAMVGVIQTGNNVGSGTGAVPGGGQPWVLLEGHASVNLGTGRLQFTVRGLVIAGGNSIGINPVPKMTGLLVCDPKGNVGGNSTLVRTPEIDVGPDGNLQFDGNLGTLPDVCSSEPDIAFLVTSVPAPNGTPPRPNGAWFAAGIARTR